jgi:hypothetical protein
MATVGHLITLTGVIFFFLMMLDTAYERRCSTSITLGIPRWYKRANYYIYKICFNGVNLKKMSELPSYKIREFLTRFYTNEYEKFKFFFILKKNLPL